MPEKFEPRDINKKLYIKFSHVTVRHFHLD